ncbi:K+/H+ antiporter subunit F [Salinarimonas ramus]|uniref:K+/H+ antiporter subunit F n=1 Tax=Salinarimonas ramus TaxID=690164 RepID=A0A917V765_9HYPH|nr:K+/H+ antiporter subunit F [Salinarimonas ramus]GGK45373.1 K+/H+ antiporter subunit F [Salinarimonas ramus]
MIEIASLVAIASIAISIALNIWRLSKGPDLLDRVLALDTMVINAIALTIMIGIWYATPVYFEAALLVAMVGFLSTVAFCKFVLRGNIIE